LTGWEGSHLERFDIHQDGLEFVSTILGFLWMNGEELGFDPTIISVEGRWYIEIEGNGQTEHLIINGVMKRAPCTAGQATTCWKAHREGDPRTPLINRDSWQYPEREEEGELLCGQLTKSLSAAKYRPESSMLSAERECG